MRILFPFVWWQEMKLYRYFRRWHEFPNGMPTLNRFRIQCWMWNFEIQFLPLEFHQNLQFYGWLEETAHLHFAGPLSSVSPASPVPRTQSWPSWTGKRIPVYAGRNGLEFILLSRIECPGMSRDTNFPTEASGWWTASTVYIHTIKLGSTSFLIFIPVFLSGLEPGPKPYCIWRKLWQEQLFPVRCHSPSSHLLFSSLSLRQHLFGSLSAQWHCAICSHLPEY